MFRYRFLCDIAEDILQHWHRPSVVASPYLMAMLELKIMDDNYGCDSAASIVRYFLANASAFRGEHAKRIKTELKQIITNHESGNI